MRIYGALALAGLLLAGVAASNRKPSAPTKVRSSTPVGTPVEVQPATTGDVVHWTSVTGSLASLQDVALSSRMAGRLAQVMVREGDKVSAGQVVARLDTVDLEARVRAEQGTVAAAEARVAQAQAALRQQVVTSRTGVESAEAAYHQQLTNTHAAIDSAEAVYRQQLVQSRTNIEAAEAALKSAKANLSQVREGSRKQEITRAETQVSIARANLNKAQADARRYQELVKEGAVAEAVAEQYQTSYDVAKEQLRAAEQSLSLVKEGARSQEVDQAEQSVRQAEERLRQARAAAAQDDVRRADLEAARAGSAQNEVRLAALQAARAARSQNDVRQAEVQAAYAALDQARSALDIARKNLADASIVSPVAGQIAARCAEPGQVVGAGSPILRVVSLDMVYFEPSVPERELGHLKVGQRVDVTVDAFPHRTFAGSVMRIYPAGSAKSRSFTVRIAIANADRLLRPQMYARGRIEVERHRQVTLIPRDALLRDDKGGHDGATGRLFTVENDTVLERTVTLGLNTPDGQRIEANGVPAQALVVTAGQRSLSDGDRVTVKR